MSGLDDVDEDDFDGCDLSDTCKMVRCKGECWCHEVGGRCS